MKKMYRCTNPDCSENPHRNEFDFEAEKPVCPKCQTDGKQMENFFGIFEIARIHLLVIAKEGPIKTQAGRRLVACNPEMKTLPKSATGDFHAVNCPQCKESLYFKHLEDQEKIQDDGTGYNEKTIILDG